MLELPPRSQPAAPMAMTRGQDFATHPFGPCSGLTRDGEVRA